MCAYLAIFLSLGYAAVAAGVPFHQWVALISVAVATAVTVGTLERGQWRLGLFVRPTLAARELLLGLSFAVILILACDALILLSTGARHRPGNGFPWMELMAVFFPAAIHEELLFRGYVFQKLRKWRRGAAIVLTAAIFAALHGGNIGVSPIALSNVFLAGVLLALSYERYARLWFPIGIHLAWNILSGPVLGYPVSGFVPAESVLRTATSGPLWLTGGNFGIEGSVWMGVAEVAGIVWLMNAERRMQNEEVRKGGISSF